jgi:glycosyltransferase involved in cell wall biosynthesis
MKIAVVIDSIAVRAGIERVVTGLAGLWADSGYDVSIVTKDGRPSAYALDSRVALCSVNAGVAFSTNRLIRYAQKFVSILKSAQCFRQYFKKNKYDYIYSATPDNTLSLFCAGVCGRSKVLASEHGAYDAYNIFFKIMKRFVYPRVYAVIAITERDAALYQKLNKNTFCMPNPLSFLSNEVSALTSKTVLAVGRLVHDKGYDRMLDIWADVSVQCPGWVLKIIGEGEEENNLRNMIRQRNLEGSVLLERTSSDIRKEYCAASVYIMTSYGEGFGMVLIEAMECGLPCVAYDCPVGPREIISHGSGFLIADGDKNEFVEKLKSLIENMTLRKEMASEGKKSAERYYPEKISRQWKELYERQQ